MLGLRDFKDRINEAISGAEDGRNGVTDFLLLKSVSFPVRSLHP